MSKKRSAAAIILVLAALCLSSFAEERFQGSVNFLVSYPQNAFRDRVDRTFYGLSGEFFCRFPRSPFSVGISLEYLNYGSETRTGPLGIDFPEVWVDVTTRNSILTSAAVLRLSPAGGPFRPYVEGLVGFNYLFTFSSVSDTDDWSDDIASTTNFDDWSFTYGAGGGAVVRVLDIRGRQGRSEFSLFLDIGVRYLKGGAAEYLKQGSILRDRGHVTYTPLSSTTDLVKTHIGIAFLF